MAKKRTNFGRDLEAAFREVLRNAVRGEAKTPERLGKRLRDLFKNIGLEEDIPELRGHEAKPADFSS